VASIDKPLVWLAERDKLLPFSLEARLEAGDPSVSLDLLIGSLISLGATERERSQIMTTPSAA
jgi:hypothetical protein